MWQPIETAPKDGKALDLWVVCTDSAWRPDGECARVTDARWSNGKWVFDSCFRCRKTGVEVEDNHYKAVYWMRYDPPEGLGYDRL